MLDDERCEVGLVLKEFHDNGTRNLNRVFVTWGSVLADHVLAYVAKREHGMKLIKSLGHFN